MLSEKHFDLLLDLLGKENTGVADDINYLKQYNSIDLRLPRQTGKAEMILNKSTSDDLVIMLNLTIVNQNKDKTNARVRHLKTENFELLINESRGHCFKTIWFDEVPIDWNLIQIFLENKVITRDTRIISLRSL